MQSRLDNAQQVADVYLHESECIFTYCKVFRAVLQRELGARGGGVSHYCLLYHFVELSRRGVVRHRVSNHDGG